MFKGLDRGTAKDSQTGRSEYGEVFTKAWVVELILDLCDFRPDRDLTLLTVIEPSAGSGAFLGPIVDRLLAARAKHAPEVPWLRLSDCIRAWDLQPDHVESCRAMVRGLLDEADCPEADAKQLADAWVHHGDFLLVDQHKLADLVVGNPPYIRIEDIPSDLLAAYRRVCPTMGGRADIFVGFYERGLDLLATDGRLAFICADRWMRNSYGRALRHKIRTGHYAVECVLSMHGVRAFDAEVSAYPAITVLKRGDQDLVATGLAKEEFGVRDAGLFCSWATSKSSASLSRPTVTGALLPRWHDSDESWPEGTPETLEWLEGLEERFPGIETAETGTKIGIGVATGADAVYVRSADDLPDVEPDRLLKLTMAADIKSGEFCWTGQYLINPWSANGVVSLQGYPKLAAYYERRCAALKRRNVAQRSGTQWYRTIDRVNLALLASPMLVMEDLKSKAHPVLVPAGYYPHHNLYFVISKEWGLEALGGMLLSEVIERQVAAYCVKMRGGTLRFQAQYLRRIRCPAPANLGQDILTDLAVAFRARDRAAATAAAMRAFGMTSLPDSR